MLVIAAVLLFTALACNANFTRVVTATPAQATMMVATEAPALADTALPATAVLQPTVTPSVLCTTLFNVNVRSCIGLTGSPLGVSPGSSVFVPEKRNSTGTWVYGNVPLGSGTVYGWVSLLNTDGSALVSCRGLETLLIENPVCPTAVPPTWTPIPPTLTPVPPTFTPVPVCGDSVCNGTETYASCPADCHLIIVTPYFPVTLIPMPICGNDVCESGETPFTCPADCHLILITPVFPWP